MAAKKENTNFEEFYSEKMISVMDDLGQEKKYLEVKFRNDWFRKINPNGLIKTSLVVCEPGRVVAKAEVYLEKEDTVPVAIDFASAEWNDTIIGRRVVENAVTKAKGRALASAGFNILDSYEETEDVCDAPTTATPLPPVKEDDIKIEKLSSTEEVSETATIIAEPVSEPVTVEPVAEGPITEPVTEPVATIDSIPDRIPEEGISLMPEGFVSAENMVTPFDVTPQADFMNPPVMEQAAPAIPQPVMEQATPVMPQPIATPTMSQPMMGSEQSPFFNPQMAMNPFAQS